MVYLSPIDMELSETSSANVPLALRRVLRNLSKESFWKQ